MTAHPYLSELCNSAILLSERPCSFEDACSPQGEDES